MHFLAHQFCCLFDLCSMSPAYTAQTTHKVPFQCDHCTTAADQQSTLCSFLKNLSLWLSPQANISLAFLVPSKLFIRKPSYLTPISMISNFSPILTKSLEGVSKAKYYGTNVRSVLPQLVNRRHEILHHAFRLRSCILVSWLVTCNQV